MEMNNNPTMPFSPLDALINALSEVRKAGRVQSGDTVLSVQKRIAALLRPIVCRIQREAVREYIDTQQTSAPSCGRAQVIKFTGIAKELCVSDTEIVVLGIPANEVSTDDNQWHNCDLMGCGADHVLVRHTLPCGSHQAAMSPVVRPEAGGEPSCRVCGVTISEGKCHSCGEPYQPNDHPEYKRGYQDGKCDAAEEMVAAIRARRSPKKRQREEE